jgi:hypothetical protein
LRGDPRRRAAETELTHRPRGDLPQLWRNCCVWRLCAAGAAASYMDAFGVDDSHDRMTRTADWEGIKQAYTMATGCFGASATSTQSRGEERWTLRTPWLSQFCTPVYRALTIPSERYCGGFEGASQALIMGRQAFALKGMAHHPIWLSGG